MKTPWGAFPAVLPVEMMANNMHNKLNGAPAKRRVQVRLLASLSFFSMNSLVVLVKAL